MATAKRFVRRVRTRPRKQKVVSRRQESQPAAVPVFAEASPNIRAEEVWAKPINTLEYMVANLRDRVMVASILSAERHNPSYPGGRKGALEVLETRLAELPE